MMTPDPKQVGRLAEPVILMNTETGLCHSVETIEILDRCMNESMKLVERKTGRSRLMQIYREATPAEIKAWEKLGRKKRGEREKTVAESRIRNAPAVVVVGGDSPAAAAAQAAQVAALTSDDGAAALKAAEEARAAAEKLAEEAKADREAAAKERADTSEAIAAAQKAVVDMQDAVAKMQAEAEAKAKADAEAAAAEAKAAAEKPEKAKTEQPAPKTSAKT